MSTVLLAGGVIIGTLALVVLAALVHAAVSYLKSRWRGLASDTQRQNSMRNQSVGP